MKQRSIFIFCLVLACAGAVFAQRTVTNSSLQKYADQRLAADREYRETYAKRGMPSPEQLKKWSDEDRAETNRLAAQLHYQNLEREWVQTQLNIAAQNTAAARAAYSAYGESIYDPNIYGYGYGGFGGYGRSRGSAARAFQSQGYFAGGQFWPSPGTVRLTPAARIGGRIGGHR